MGRGEPLRALPIPLEAQFTLQSVLEDFCERLSRSWSRELELHPPVRCQDVVADSYAAFVLSRPQPTCFEVFSLGQMEGKLLLEFPYGTLFALLEWLLGERQASSPPPARSLTRLERRFMRWMHGNILESLTAAWDGIVPLQPHWERLETNARVVRCMPATEPILIATVGLELLGSVRDLRVALPLRSCFRACLGDYRAAAQL